MKKRVLLMAAVVWGGMAMAGPVKFHAEIKPIGFLISPDVDGVGVGYSSGFHSYSEEIVGYGSYLGSIELGVQIDTKVGYLDLLAGGGGVLNGVFAGGLFLADVGYRFKLNKSGTLALGPFLGVVVPGDTTWATEEGSDVDLVGNGGAQAGLKFTWGWKHVSFLLQGGYMGFTYDMTHPDDGNTWTYTKDGWDTSESWAAGESVELDMSGFFAEFGVGLQF